MRFFGLVSATRLLLRITIKIQKEVSETKAWHRVLTSAEAQASLGAHSSTELTMSMSKTAFSVGSPSQHHESTALQKTAFDSANGFRRYREANVRQGRARSSSCRTFELRSRCRGRPSCSEYPGRDARPCMRKESAKRPRAACLVAASSRTFVASSAPASSTRLSSPPPASAAWGRKLVTALKNEAHLVAVASLRLIPVFGRLRHQIPPPSLRWQPASSRFEIRGPSRKAAGRDTCR